MKGNEKHITNLEQLAESGWKQMHETLVAHGLSGEATLVSQPSKKKRKVIFLIAAAIVFVLILSYPFVMNDKVPVPIKGETTNTNVSLSIPSESYQPEENIQKKAKSTQRINEISPASETKNLLATKIKSDYMQSRKERAQVLDQEQKKGLAEKFSARKVTERIEEAIEINYGTKSQLIKDSSYADSTIKPKPKPSVSKKIRFFAGAGLNVSGGNLKASDFTLKGLNIHPGFTVVVPLSQKISIHSGLWAFSTVHGKEVSAKEKEIVNGAVANVYYNINTTSIIKTSYFDLPINIHYAINENWSAGAGVQFSKLYKINIREEKQSYDYSNTLFSATVDQINASPNRAAAAFEKKVEIKKYETRLMAEANYQVKQWLFSAGYYYGLGKNITLKDAGNSSHQYRNEYFKLAVQYRIGGK